MIFLSFMKFFKSLKYFPKNVLTLPLTYIFIDFIITAKYYKSKILFILYKYNFYILWWQRNSAKSTFKTFSRNGILTTAMFWVNNSWKHGLSMSKNMEDSGKRKLDLNFSIWWQRQTRMVMESLINGNYTSFAS